MTHHGWVHYDHSDHDFEDAARLPFGRLMPAAEHKYHSHEIALMAGAHGPFQDSVHPVASAKPGLHSGFTFLGQFIDHDLTEFVALDPALIQLPNSEIVGRRHHVMLDSGKLTARSGRTGRLDLDSVYGLGGTVELNLFDQTGLFRLRDDRDIPRDIADEADKKLIADPRNDENKIVVQLHVLFEKLHNRIHTARIASRPGEPSYALTPMFRESQAEVQQIFRQIVICDYLPRIVDPALLAAVIDALKAGDALYNRMTNAIQDEAQRCGFRFAADLRPMPVEFAHAVFRLGHTQLRDAYKMNAKPHVKLFQTRAGEADLRGDTAITDDTAIEWDYFFDTAAGVVEFGAALDGKLPKALFRLPRPSIGDAPIALSERNIRRGIDFGLPSGQEAYAALAAVYGAAIMGPPLTPLHMFPQIMRDGYPDILTQHAGTVSFEQQTPLWYYIIQEAALLTGTERLGAVGGLICAETILGSLFYDDAASVAAHVEKVVDAGGPVPGNPVSKPAQIFTMVQLLELLGVVKSR